MSFLQKVLTENPANAEAHVLLGSVQLLKNAPDQAVQSFRAAIEQQPKDTAGYRALANFYLGNKDFDEAEKVIRASLQEQPDSFAMHLTYAGLLEQKGDYKAAIAEYEILLKQDPGSLIAANNLASLLPINTPTKPAWSGPIHLRQYCANRKFHTSKIRSDGSTTCAAITKAQQACSKKRQRRCLIWPLFNTISV